MNISRPRILLEHIQIKSLEKAQRLAAALEVIEVECGIKETEIRFQGVFVCPWIDLTKLDNGPMEQLLRDLLIRLDRKLRGKNSKYHKQGEKDARPENSSL